MKRLKKLSAFLLTLMLCVGVVSMPVEAADSTITQDGLEITLTTDKEEYSDGEEIKLTLTVKNTNTEAVTDIELASFISDGYELTEESIQALKELVKLGAGAEESVPITVVKKDTTGSVPGDPEPGNSNNNVATSILKSPNTADNNNIALWAAVFFVGVALIGGAYAIKNKKAKQALSIMLCVAMAASTFVTTSVPVSAEVQDKTVTLEKTVKYAGEDVTFTANFSYKFEDGYKLVWADEFDGTELNRDDWNVELHDPGWVNAELQAYVDSSENIYLEDGKLVIKPIQVKNADGTYSYTSGRINTQNKQTFKYGKFEARVKVPTGKGYLPAFWLMANDENLYGQWPRCGEIDIMEVHGSATETAYGTIHYGNPHSESQGTYSLSEGTFADEFHTFTCEWEPGKISWYVDGILFHTENDWYSATEGQGELTYPAPFDQPFYVILNLAVGGSWVGYPDDATFVSDTYEVDYVRVYQKDSYDENVTKPEKEVILRDPDANGNYIINGDFAVAEDLTDDEAWKFLLADGGAGTAEIKNNEMVINSTAAGNVDYSVQLVQANLPMKEGATYTLTFDAYADEARTMIVDVSAPDRSYARYLPDTKLNLTTEKQTYTYTFKMTSSDDANGRLEFNLGNQGSIAGVHISNVKLVESAYEAPSDEVVKTVLADGNHVYNGQFQEGSDRMEYWDVTNNVGAQVSVTNENNVRKLMIVAPEGTSAENPVIISQSELAMVDGSAYTFSAEVQGEAGKSINVTVAGVTDTYALTGEAQTIAKDFTQVAGNDKNIAFIITQPGTYYIDNVSIVEDSLIKNGSFSAGFSGYEPFVDSGIASEVTYVVDSLNETNAADFTINNTGTQDWHIQLKQNNVELEKDQWYNLSLKMKSSIARDVSVAIQRDGSTHKDANGNEDWTPYLQKTVTLGSDYQTYTFDFQMTEATDLASIFNVTMGAVGGTQITQQHRICIDDIVLEKIDAPEQEEIVAGENLIKNADFASGMDSWKVDAYDGGAATTTTGDGKITLDITGLGTVSSCVKLNQKDITLEQGATYKMKFAIKSSEARAAKWGLMTDTYNWYDGQDLDLAKDETEYVDYEFTVTQATTNTINFYVSMGQMCELDANYQDDPNAPINTPLSVIEISEISLVKLSGGEEETTPVDITLSDISLVKTKDAIGAEVTDGTNIAVGEWEGSATVENGVINTTVTDPGTNPWDVQLQQFGINLDAGCEYTLSFKAKADAAKLIQVGLQQNSDPYAVYSLHEGNNIAAQLSDSEQAYTIVFTMNSTGDPAAKLFFNLGNVTNENAGYIWPADSEEAEETPEATPIAGGLLQNANFANNGAGWSLYTHKDDSVTATADVSYENGKAIVNVTNPGNAHWNVKLAQSGLTFETGATYQVKFKVASDAIRFVSATIQPSDGSWSSGTEWLYVPAGETPTDFDKTVTINNTPSDNLEFNIALGYFDNQDVPSPTNCTIKISDISLEKVTEETGSESDGATAVNLLKNGDFSNGTTDWQTNIFTDQADGPEGTASVSGSDAAMVYELRKVGSENWHVQLKQTGLTIEKGATYTVKLDISSTASRKVECGFYTSTNESQYLGALKIDLDANVPQTFSGEITPLYDGDTFTISLGQMSEWNGTENVKIETAPSTITIDNISIVKK